MEEEILVELWEIDAFKLDFITIKKLINNKNPKYSLKKKNYK